MGSYRAKWLSDARAIGLYERSGSARHVVLFIGACRPNAKPLERTSTGLSRIGRSKGTDFLEGLRWHGVCWCVPRQPRSAVGLFLMGTSTELVGEMEMNSLTKLTVCVSALALAFSATACGDGETDDDNAGGSSNTGGNSTGVGGNGTGATASGGNGAGAGGLGGGGGDRNAPKTILELAEGRSDLSVFVQAVEKAELTDALAQGPRTVFLPTSNAFSALFAQLGLESVADLTPAQLAPILRYHVLDSVVTANAAIALAPGEAKGTSLGGRFEIAYETNKLFIDEATVVESDITVSNGIVHIVDEVLLPSITDIVTTDPTFSELNTAVATADAGSGEPKVGEVLDGPSSFSGGQWLVFAPRNQALAGLTLPTNQNLTNLLLYHTVPSANPPTKSEALSLDEAQLDTAYLLRTITVDGGTSIVVRDLNSVTVDANVTVADIYAANGIIHIIDNVLIPE